MFSRKFMVSVLTALLLLSLLGCATRERLAVNEAHREFSCPKENIKVKEIGVDMYQVLACGNLANYRCDKFTKLCSKQEGEAQ